MTQDRHANRPTTPDDRPCWREVLGPAFEGAFPCEGTLERMLDRLEKSK